MENKNSHRGMLILAAALGAIAGGILVALITRAVPRMVRRSAQAVIGTLIERMKEISDGMADG